MANIAQESKIQSNGAFPTTVDSVWRALGKIDKVLISQGAANARIRKAKMLNEKSDEDLAAMGLHRDDILRFVFFEI